MVGIISYGSYIPYYRIKTAEIAGVWGKNAESIEKSLGVSEKTVAALDEDAATLGLEAAQDALTKTTLSPTSIESVFVGSESHPYAVNPTSTTIAEFLNIGNNYFSSDLEFACKAGTTGFIVTCGLIQANKVNYGLVIGSDCAQAKPHDVLEYTAASASAAFILGNKKDEIVAEILDYTSYSSDTPDFWRRDGITYPSHGGRFTGEPSYFTHVLEASKSLLAKTNRKPKDFSKCIFHMPNGKFPLQAAQRLGFSAEQIKDSLIVNKIGNPYTASSLLGLISTLDSTKPNEYIFMASYGSGAGSDAFIIRTTPKITSLQKNKYLLDNKINNKAYLSYNKVLKLRGII